VINIIYNNILEIIGNTPIIKLNKIQQYYNLNFNLYAKIEYINPFGSIKDRIALNMIEELIKNKNIKENDIIIEATSGNTGIGLAHVCKYYNLKLVIIISKKVSIERIKLLKLLGCKLILVNNIDEAVQLAKLLEKRLDNSFYISQFTNKKNYQAHYKTAKEIIKNIPNIDYIISGIGSGGTITGISKYIKHINKNIKIIGIEPIKKSNTLIQGIGTSFIPEILDKKNIYKTILVDDFDSINQCKILMEKEGLFVGFSSGAVLSGIIKNKELFKESSNVLLIFPDNGMKYLSLY
jgi:cysteine synthase A